MRMDTAELIGPALRYAVCLALGDKISPQADQNGLWVERLDGSKGWVDFRKERQRVEFDTDWGLAGPVIDREDIDLVSINHRNGIDKHEARMGRDGMNASASGPTKLIAAARCLAVFHLGNEVDVSDALLPKQPAPVRARKPRM